MEIKESEAKVIILSGKARAGKDTTASYLKKEFESIGKCAIILQFSHYIKEYAKVISDWSGSEEDKPRELLQVLGTDIIRSKIDNDFFTKRMIEDIKVYSFFYDIVLISDARFVREIELIKSNFKSVVSINIERPNYESDLTISELNHSTETGLFGYTKFDYEIINDGSLDDLLVKSKEIFSKIK